MIQKLEVTEIIIKVFSRTNYKQTFLSHNDDNEISNVIVQTNFEF